jgi:hypothetical protein
MTYSFVKPDAGPSPKDDVVQIRTNFSQFATIFNGNHTALNASNAGDHEPVVFTLQSADPGVTQDLDVLYCKNASSQAGTQPQLFVQIPDFLPNHNDPTVTKNDPMQLTYNSVNTAGPVYQSFLPGGYLLFFGSTSNIAVNITLSPAPTKILVAIATPNTMTTVGTPRPFFVSTQIVSNSTFKINSSLNIGGPVIAYSFGWVAIAQV